MQQGYGRRRAWQQLAYRVLGTEDQDEQVSRDGFRLVGRRRRHRPGYLRGAASRFSEGNFQHTPRAGLGAGCVLAQKPPLRGIYWAKLAIR